MLVLSRQQDEQVVIVNSRNPSEVIVVSVASIRGEKVRIGFEAPGHFSIDRLEVYRSKQRAGIKSGGNHK